MLTKRWPLVGLLGVLFLCAACRAGPGVPLAGGCEPGDLDADSDVDLADAALFQAVFTGPRGGGSGAAPANPYLFTGRRLDFDLRDTDGSVTGQPARPLLVLYDYRARTYAPFHGRFCQRDPALYAESLNLYQYALSNPAAFSDPTGQFTYIGLLKSVAIQSLLGATAGAAIGGPVGAVQAALGGGDWVQGFTQGAIGGAVGGGVGGATYGFLSGAGLIAAVISGGSGGFAEGFTISTMSGNDMEAALADALASGIIGAATGGLLDLAFTRSPVIGRPRAGSAAVKSADPSDAYHAFSDLIDAFAGEGSHFRIRGNDGAMRDLYQVEGSLDGVDGVFEWIVDAWGNVVHRRFKPGGSANGVPN